MLKKKIWYSFNHISFNLALNVWSKDCLLESEDKLVSRFFRMQYSTCICCVRLGFSVVQVQYLIAEFVWTICPLLKVLTLIWLLPVSFQVSLESCAPWLLSRCHKMPDTNIFREEVTLWFSDSEKSGHSCLFSSLWEFHEEHHGKENVVKQKLAQIKRRETQVEAKKRYSFKSTPITYFLQPRYTPWVPRDSRKCLNSWQSAFAVWACEVFNTKTITSSIKTCQWRPSRCLQCKWYQTDEIQIFP